MHVNAIAGDKLSPMSPDEWESRRERRDDKFDIHPHESLYSERRTNVLAEENMGASERIDNLVAELTDWRGKMFADIRRIIHEADPEIVEEWKWMGTPVWSHGGIVCIANAFKDKVKLTFDEGASVADPDKLYNNGLAGKKWRTIDYFKDDRIKKIELRNLVRSAVDYNLAKTKTKAGTKKTAK